MKILWLVYVMLLGCASAYGEDYLLEINFGREYWEGVRRGDMFWTKDGASSYAEPIRMQKLDYPDIVWLRHKTDEDLTSVAFLEWRKVRLTDIFEWTVFLICHSDCSTRNGNSRWLGKAYAMDKNGKITIGTWVQKTIGWDKDTGWPDKYLKYRTGCPDCDKAPEEKNAKGD